MQPCPPPARVYKPVTFPRSGSGPGSGSALSSRFGFKVQQKVVLNRTEPNFGNASPNDARRVVWALGMFLFSFFRVLYILTNGVLFYLGCIYVLYAQEGFGWTAIVKTGPKDIRHVFWALGTIFLIFNFFSCVLYILTNGFLFCLGCIYVLQAL